MDVKTEKLKQLLADLSKEGVLLAFSGGADSALLLAIMAENLPLESFAAVTFTGIMFPHSDIEDSTMLASRYKVNHIIREFPDIPDNILNNPRERCYLCKKNLFLELQKTASEYGFAHVADGTNADDLTTHRPGLAALSELGIASPLAESSFTKAEVRALAKAMGIPLSDKPSSPCLATRFEYGACLTPSRLRIASEAENIVCRLISGTNDIRVRFHGNEINLARIELPKQCFGEAISKHESIVSSLKTLGIKYITLDLQGFRSGSMDE